MEEQKRTDINKQNNQTTILDLLNIFLKYKKQIFVFTLVGCIISIVVYFFVLDLIYTSTASIKSTSKAGGLLGSLGSGIPDIEGLDELGVGGGKSTKELAAYEEILISRRCLEELIDKFGLMQRDEYRFKEDALKSFREEQMQIKIEKQSGIMYVSVLDKDPQLAKEMVEFLLTQLDKINIELNVTNAKNNREFIEKRYFQAKEDLKNTEDTLKSFQQIYGIAPDLQFKASAQSVFALEAELKAEEVKLDVIKRILSADQPEVKLQEAKVNSLRSKITEISASTDLTDYLRLGNSPQIILSYLRLQRDMEIQAKIITFLLPLYEQAKIEEKRETPTILILDKPFVSERKTKPKRLTMVLVFTFVGFVLSYTFFLGLHKFRSFKGSLKEYNKSNES